MLRSIIKLSVTLSLSQIRRPESIDSISREANVIIVSWKCNNKELLACIRSSQYLPPFLTRQARYLKHSVFFHVGLACRIKSFNDMILPSSDRTYASRPDRGYCPTGRAVLTNCSVCPPKRIAQLFFVGGVCFFERPY